MVDFELIFARFCDPFWVTIRNLLDFSIEVSIVSRLHSVPLALVITNEVVFVFNLAWFSSYKLKTKWTNSLARTIYSAVYQLHLRLGTRLWRHRSSVVTNHISGINVYYCTL